VEANKIQLNNLALLAYKDAKVS